MSTKVLIRNNGYTNTRMTMRSLTYGSTQSNDYITECQGDRYYVDFLGAGGHSGALEAATFESFFSFTMSAAQNYIKFECIPMEPNTSAMVEVKATGVSNDGSKAIMQTTFGGFVHNGTFIREIENTIVNKVSEFDPLVRMDYSITATSSIGLNFFSDASLGVDWDVYVKYSKGFHIINGSTPPTGPPPIYPIYNNASTS